MPISYKNKIYTTLGTPTALSGDVVSATDSSGVPAKDYTVKGRTIVWNQLVQNGNFVDATVWYTSNGTGSVSNNNYTFTVTGTQTYSYIGQYIDKSFFIANHKYYVTATIVPQYNTGQIAVVVHNGNDTQLPFWTEPASSGETKFVSTTFIISSAFVSNATDDTRLILYCPQTESAQGNVTTISNVWMTDLTKMFGAGNEPSTPEEFRAMFPDDYYPYNAGELKSIMPTSVEASGVERFQLLDKSKFTATTTINGVTFTNNGDGTITYNGTLSTGSANYNLQSGLKVIAGHKYFSYVGENTNSKISVLLYASSDPYNTFDDRFPIADGGISTALKNSDNLHYQPKPLQNISYSNFILKPQFFDLTEMFGAGNEPATVAEFWQRVPEKLYGYNPNDYKSANIPSSKYFPNGMRSAGSAYDEINFLSQKAIKRVGVVDMGTLNWSWESGLQRFNAPVPNLASIVGARVGNVLSSKFITDLTAKAGDNWKGFSYSGIVYVYTTEYTDAAAFKAAMSGVMLYYELATPVETAITPPLQALSTYRGFTSFSAPNSLTQNGPLSVTYYAEGGANPEKGWLTSYKRKLYMGRNIEWNQLLDKSKYPATVTTKGFAFTNNGDGSITINGTAISTADSYFGLKNNIEIPVGHKVLISGGVTGAGWSSYMLYDASDPARGFDVSGGGKIYTVQTSPVKPFLFVAKGYTVSNITFKPQLFDLTQMFGAGNEPSTPEEFWSYFDHKLYPYNPGETQPLFKISRKSRGGGKHYTARWDKVNAAMVRLNDAASFPTDTSNFGNFGSVNPNYSNPFDSIYPWSGIRICNIDLDAYMALQPGDSITRCVKAWEGDPDFDWLDDNGVWRYRPEFWGSSWDDGTYRYFDVTDRPAGGYVHYPEAIAGCWHGRAATKTVNGEPTTCLLPLYGIPVVRTAMSTLHAYAKNYGATLDSIYSIDADLLLLTVEYATMNSQRAIGDGATNLYRQGGYQIAAAATDSNVIKVLAADAGDYFVYGAIVDIGTTDGGNQVGSYYVTATAPDTDPTYLNVTLTSSTTVTRENYWSIHGIINDPYRLRNFGNKSGYIGTNGRAMAFYRGMELYGNMWFYTLGAYENAADKHIWIAADAEQADAYDALDTSVHIDTGLALPTSPGYIQTLGLPPRSGLLALPPFCTAVGGSSANPVGDYFYNGDYTYNTVLLRGGAANIVSAAGALCGYWIHAASGSLWNYSARPLLKTPQGG